MKTTFYRAVYCAILITTIFNNFLLAQIPNNSSGLRNAPTQVDAQETQITALLAKSESYFHEGELELQNKNYKGAREKFDKAVETILLSGLNVRSYPKLNTYYGQLIERVYRLEVPMTSPLSVNPASVAQNSAMPNGQSVAQVQTPDIPQIGFGDQKYEVSPLDDLATLKLDAVEQNVETPEAQQSYQQVKVAAQIGSLGFTFQSDARIQQFINYYQGRGRATMETGLYRSGQFAKMARRIFREEAVPENIIWLGQVESAWKPWARSSAAASGLWQFIPGTGIRFGLRQNAYVDERNSLEKATRASAKYLKFLANRYNGNYELAMAAYNSGEGNVDSAIRKAGVSNFWAAYPYLPRETKNYVPNILATIIIANNPRQYGFGNVRPSAPFVYDQVRIPTSTSLNLLAQAMDTSVETLRYMNPELRQNITPNEPYIVRVPPGRSKELVAVLRRIPSYARNSANLTTIAAGEDLQSLSNRTGVSQTELQTLNPNIDLKRGGKIVVPSKGNGVNSTAYARPRGNAPALKSGLETIRANAGDTITTIAARYGFAATDLAGINGVQLDAPLQAGREIRIPPTRR